jgi:ABC-type lipoprotein release transport system permease subunit
MKLYKLAWRNIWRNKRRAVITIASIFFALFFCTVMWCFEAGVWDKMIENSLKTQAGNIEIHQKGFWDDKTVDNFMIMEKVTIDRLEAIDNIANVSPRIETFAMASCKLLSKGISVVGISPAKEAAKSNLPSHLIAGEYLTDNDDGVLIGEGLSKYLKIALGDTLAFIGQGYHGASAAGLFPVRGILRLPLSEMDNGMAYANLQTMQQFIEMPDGYSGVLISLKNDKKLNETMNVVARTVGETPLQIDKNTIVSGDYEILSWHFTMKQLLQSAESDKAFGKLMLFILYLIVGFGIFGTVIMMTNERQREFAMIISLGMQRQKVKIMIAVEMLLITLVGIAVSLVFTIPVACWFALHPIEMTGEMAKAYTDYGMEPVMPFSTDPVIFINQIIIVLALSALSIIYPIKVIHTSPPLPPPKEGETEDFADDCVTLLPPAPHISPSASSEGRGDAAKLSIPLRPTPPPSEGAGGRCANWHGATSAATKYGAALYSAQ